MPEAALAPADHELQMLGALVNSAFALSESFSEAAKAETDHARRLQLFDAFCRGSLAVRMGIRLSMALRAGPKAVAAAKAEPAEVEKPDFDPPRERTEGLERERDRDYEPVSLPKFLATLGVVAADAARLDALPASVRDETLPALNALLAQANAGAVEPPTPVQRPTAAATATAVNLLTRPPPAAPKRHLLGSTSPVLSTALASRPRPPPRGSG